MARKGSKIVLNDDNKFELIQLWEGEECLYNPGIADYSNSNKRIAAIKRIKENMSVDITEEQIRDVQKSLRTTYQREMRKKKTSECSGRGTDQVHKIKWKFFDVLSFLGPYLKPIQSESSLSSFPSFLYGQCQNNSCGSQD